MIEDNIHRVSSSESTDSSTTKHRKKRKWDQPAESVVSGILPLSNMGSLSGTSLPGVATMSGVYFSNPLTATVPTFLPAVPSLPPQQAVAISQKLSQIQDEVIAREIVINDADSNVRYKLTKRHTQEEIQKVTGAIVITRGKYKPQNALLDGEKPLYLHISAGAHLETMAERIKAVDRAAAMVEEMLKHGSLVSGVNVSHNLNACVYLGFETDPSSNIAARIRGPNDQYVNHIMNETGATVILRGLGSENSESAPAEEGQQPLHLFLSSNNLKSLERAKLLAENLLDTISAEFSAKRFSSSKVYGAVPPPPQLFAEVQSSKDESNANIQPATGLTASALGCSASSAVPSMTVPAASIIASSGLVPHEGCPNSGSGQSPADAGSYSYCTLSHGTSYNGYGGIYPNATPLQQVALALRHSTSPVTTLVAPTVTSANTASYVSTSSSLEKEKRSSQKRKFQESPAVVKGLVNPEQVSELAKTFELTSDIGAKDDKSLMKPSTNGLLPNPSKVMPRPPPKFTASPDSSLGVRIRPSTNELLPNSKVMPPPPPKFTESSPGLLQRVHNESKSESVPDTLIKLMEYGDEDEDDEDDDDELSKPNREILNRSSNSSMVTKPFWAV